MNKMNPEIKKLWLSALRSGEYSKTTRSLRDESGFCCLGVLCDLHFKENGVDYWTTGDDGTIRYLTHGGILPPNVQTWAGLDSTIAVENFQGRGLAAHNDGYHEHDEDEELIWIPSKPFSEIAEIINEVL